MPFTRKFGTWLLLPTLIFGLCCAAIAWRDSRILGETRDAEHSPRLAILDPRVAVTEAKSGHEPITVVAQAGRTRLDTDQAFDLQLGNVGEAPVEISLDRVSCGCVRKVLLNGVPLMPRGPAVPISGKDATLRVIWHVERNEAPVDLALTAGRIVLLLRSNDRRAQALRLEIVTNLIER
jgi:hypothetical protein